MKTLLNEEQKNKTFQFIRNELRNILWSIATGVWIIVGKN